MPKYWLIRSKVTATCASLTATSEPTAVPETTVPLANSAIIAAATSQASPTVAWLIPFSNLLEDSLRKLNCLDVLRIDNGLNNAASKATVVVS